MAIAHPLSRLRSILWVAALRVMPCQQQKLQQGSALLYQS